MHPALHDRARHADSTAMTADADRPEPRGRRGGSIVLVLLVAGGSSRRRSADDHRPGAGAALYPRAAGAARHGRAVQPVRFRRGHHPLRRPRHRRSRQAASPTSAFDGLAVTDPSGHVVYSNAAYLALTGAGAPQDVRPVERVFIGNPDVSEAVFRLLKAAREGKRQQEEVRIAGLDGGRPLAADAGAAARRRASGKPDTRCGRSPT